MGGMCVCVCVYTPVDVGTRPPSKVADSTTTADLSGSSTLSVLCAVLPCVLPCVLTSVLPLVLPPVLLSVLSLVPLLFAMLLCFVLLVLLASAELGVGLLRLPFAAAICCVTLVRCVVVCTGRTSSYSSA